MQVVTVVLRGRDVFALLPTDYGKTLCYAVLPAAFDTLSPKGLKTCCITGGQLENACAKEAAVAATRLL